MKPILTFFCFLLLVSPGFAKDKRPNVVTLFVDDLGFRDIGCYGGPVKTPVLDKLAAEGVRFTDFHSGAPVCSPSRAALMTGRTPMSLDFVRGPAAPWEPLSRPGRPPRHR